MLKILRKGVSGSRFEARSQDPFLEDPDRWRHIKGPSRSLKSGCAGPVFGGQREASQERKQANFPEQGRDSSSAESMFGPAARKWNVGPWKSKIEAARPLFDRFGPLEPQKRGPATRKIIMIQSDPAGPLFARFRLLSGQKGVQEAST